MEKNKAGRELLGNVATSIDAMLKHSVEEGQHFYQFKNGWCLSVICNEWSYGVEAALGKWRVRQNTTLEKILDWLARKHPERVEWLLVSGDVLKHPSFMQNVYAFLKPDELEEIKRLTAALQPWKEWQTE